MAKKNTKPSLTRSIRFENEDQRSKAIEFFEGQDISFNKGIMRILKKLTNGVSIDDTSEKEIASLKDENARLILEVQGLKSTIENVMNSIKIHNSEVVKILKEAVPLILNDSKKGALFLGNNMKKFVMEGD